MEWIKALKKWYLWLFPIPGMEYMFAIIVGLSIAIALRIIEQFK